MTRRLLVILLLIGLGAGTTRAADNDEALLQRALTAERELRSADALELLLELAVRHPDDAFVQQKIARQYSDLIVDQTDAAQQRAYARQARDHAERAVTLAPDDPVNVLSLAIARGKLAIVSDTRTKIALSRRIKADAERALALDPDYAWAHHILGRWHLEVARLGSVSRFVVGLVYGGLPDASVAEAVRHLERAVALEPNELNHHLELGFAYAAAGRKAEARRQFQFGLNLPNREKHDQLAKDRARAALAALG